MSVNRFFARLLWGAAALLGGLPAQAQVLAPPLDIELRYQVDLAPALPTPITNILTFHRYANGGGGAWWASEVPADTVSHTITDPFLKSSDNAPLQALMLGLVQGLPGDGSPGQQHVVLMMSDAAASAANHIAWGTLFRTTLEANVIDAIVLATSGQDIPVIQPGLDVLDAFVTGEADNGILGPGGVPISAWFSLGAVQPGSTSFSNFTVMAFSDGQVLGTGIASLTTTLPVPEPGTLALALAGLAVMSLRARRMAGR